MSSVREENVGAGGDKVSRVQWREWEAFCLSIVSFLAFCFKPDKMLKRGFANC